MANPRQHWIPIFRTVQRAAATILALALGFGLAGGTLVARAQTLTVLHTFNGGPSDGAGPFAGVTVDVGGNLYGTTYYGGPLGQGVVYRLARKNGHWIFTPLYTFDGSYGSLPKARVVIGPNGSLYGTTSSGEGGNCDLTCGLVFNLKPTPTIPPTPETPWIITPLYIFSGNQDGGSPQFGDLVFDSSGNIYGTTMIGGSRNLGTVYQLSPSSHGYIESVLHSFTDGYNGGDDGYYPYGSVALDGAGNVYTTTSMGGPYDIGLAIELSPSNGTWIESYIHSFTTQSPDGFQPMAGLIFDRAGNLYGTTYRGAPDDNENGIVYELTPSNGSWTETILHGFPLVSSQPPGGPQAALVMDAAGNLYGTTTGEGIYGWGNVFELSPSNGGWVYKDIYDFTGGSDGGYPYSNIAFDSAGNLYGTASTGGNPTCNCGVVWQIQMP